MSNKIYFKCARGCQKNNLYKTLYLQELLEMEDTNKMYKAAKMSRLFSTEELDVLKKITKKTDADSTIATLIDEIGSAAMLEQLSEEAAELSVAAAKVARFLRGENKVYKPKVVLLDNLHEEMADVVICMQAVSKLEGIYDEYLYQYHEDKKMERMHNRLQGKDD